MCYRKISNLLYSDNKSSEHKKNRKITVCDARSLCMKLKYSHGNISLSVKFNVEIIVLYVECRNWNVSLKNHFSCNEKSKKKKI